MKSAIVLSLLTTAWSAAIEKRDANAEAQIGGGLFGSVPGASGFLTGIVAGPTVSGELGGIAVDPTETAAPAIKEREAQIGGGLFGSVPDASGFLSGIVAGPTVSGELSGIAIDPLPTETAAPAIKEREAQIGGGLFGSVPDASGFLSGIVAGPTVSGELGGIAIDPLALETAAPAIKEREAQIGGGLFGSVTDASGFLTGIVAAPTVSGELGGIAVDPLSLETPAPSLAKRQDDPVGGGLGGFISSIAAGTISGAVISGVPFGCIGGLIPGETLGATLCGTAPASTST